MNAYELADELQELDSKLHLINLFKSSNMLRQQANRIAELEKSHIELEKGIVADLNQRQNAEPVAWIAYDDFGDFMLEATKEGDYPWQPLYTTPQTKQCKDCGEINPAEIHTCSPQTKPLSDEEILKIYDNYVMSPVSPHGSICDFARAIEAKVKGEK